MAAFLSSFVLLLHIINAQMPLPWTRELRVTDPMMSGNDILIATTLMSRCECWPFEVMPSLNYSSAISSAVSLFQSHFELTMDGIFGPNTAQMTLSHYSFDGFMDDNIKAIEYSAKYKIYIPVYNDSERNIQTIGHLMDAHNKILLSFETRTHGQSNPPTSEWPNYDNSVGLNQFSSNGNTPTGLAFVDLNSPEIGNNASMYYGAYPIQRIISGIKHKNVTSNMALLLQPQSTNIRSGILMHTGQWPQWNESDSMPDSDGCIHVAPDTLQQINKILINDLDVVVHNNTYSSKDYPYQPQGIISIQQIH